jgi:hypothetical protein
MTRLSTSGAQFAFLRRYRGAAPVTVPRMTNFQTVHCGTFLALSRHSPLEQIGVRARAGKKDILAGRSVYQ